MEKRNPSKTFIPIPPVDSTCGCNNCQYMRLNTLEKIYNCLKNETPEILVDEAIRVKAVKPILKMLEMSK
jgi:quinolinate synthase